MILATVNRLYEMDIQAVMITGDAEAIARFVAEDLGIDRYYARVRKGLRLSFESFCQDRFGEFQPKLAGEQAIANSS